MARRCEDQACRASALLPPVWLAAVASLGRGGAPAAVLVKPDPLSISPVAAHSADADRDFRIGLIELTRVIELYNTRLGTTRTGRYKVQAGTEDGFAPGM